MTFRHCAVVLVSACFAISIRAEVAAEFEPQSQSVSITGTQSGQRIHLATTADGSIQLLCETGEFTSPDGLFVSALRHLTMDGAGTLVLDTVQIPSSLSIAAEDIEIAGVVKAPGATLQLNARNRLLISGSIDVSAVECGSVYLTGNSILIDHHARVMASGQRAGSVNIGGGLKGEGSVRRALETRIESGAVIEANGVGNAPGGTIIVWSNRATSFKGGIEARGGYAGGDGGMVEVSGKRALDFSGNVDTSAFRGQTGTLLLDPASIVIRATSPDIAGDLSNNDITAATDLDNAAADFPGAASIITTGALVTLLQSSDVTLAATNTISLQSQLDYNGIGNTGRTLTLQAGNGITIESTGSIVDSNTATADRLNLVFTADFDTSGVGILGVLGPITTGGGSITGTGALNAVGHGIFLNGIAIDTDAATGTGGAVTLTATNTGGEGIYLGSGTTIDTGGGAVLLTGTGANHGILFDPTTSSITTGGGNLTLNGTGGTLAFSNGLAFRATVALNSGGGNISLTGTAANGHGISFETATTLTAVSGNINLNGTSTGTGQGVFNGIFASAGVSLAPTTGSLAVTAGSNSENAFYSLYPITWAANAGLTVTGTATGAFGNGLLFSAATDLQSPAGPVLVNGQSTANHGVLANQSFLAKGASLSITGTTTTTNSGCGILFNSSADLQASAGSVSLNGQSTRENGILTQGTFLAQGSGPVSLVGKSTGGSFACGILQRASSPVIRSTGSTLTIDGQAVSNHGIFSAMGGTLEGPTGLTITATTTKDGTPAILTSAPLSLTSSTGSVSVTGTQTGGGTFSSAGIMTYGLSASGQTGVSLTGTSSVFGIANVSSGDFTAQSAAGPVTISGTGATHGIFLQGNSSTDVALLTSPVGVTLTGTGGNQFGIFARNLTAASSAGQVVLNGTGSANYGTFLNGTISLNGNKGVTVQGTGAGSSFGVHLNNAATITSAAGPVNLTGTCPGGVGMFSQGTTTVSGAQDVTIVGNGGNAFGAFLTNITLSSTSGAVTVSGSNSNSSSSSGLFLSGACTTSNGAITLTGTNAGSADGIFFQGGSLTSAGGAIALNGSSATTGSFSRGIFMNAGSINSGGGSVSFLGNSASLQGIFLNPNTSITSAGGAIALTGNTTGTSGFNVEGIFIDDAFSGAPATVSSGGGSIAISGRSAVADGVLIDAFGPNNANVNSGTGNLTITGDRINLVTTNTGATLNGTGALTLQPETVNAPMLVGGPGMSGPDFLNSAEILKIGAGFSSVTVGRADSSGTITVDPTGATFANPLVLRTPANGTINLSGALSTSNNKAITLNGDVSTAAASSVAITAGTADVTFQRGINLGGAGLAQTQITGNLVLGPTSTLNLTVSGPTTADKFNVTGAVTLGGTLTPTLGYTVQPVDKVLFIDNDAADTVSGNFANLQPQTLLTIGGSKFIALKNAGTGNDVVLAINKPPVFSSLTVTPADPFVLQLVTVTAAAVDPDNLDLAFLYDYGDGTFDSTGMHTYMAPGTYTITVSVTDGEPITMAKTIVVSAGAGTADDDGDGFNNEIEMALNSNPYSAISTPFGLAKPAPGPAPTIKRFSTRLNFKVSHKDKIAFNAQMPVTSTFSPTNQRVILDVGGVVKSFTGVSAKRFVGPYTDDNLRLAVRKQVANALVNLSLQNFKPQLADENLTASTSGSRTVHVVFIFNGTRYETDVVKTYKGTAKTGILK